MHKKSVLCLMILVLSLGFLFSCGEDETPVEVSLDKREEISIRPQAAALTYAYLPQYSHTESFQRHNRLVEYLSQETGLSIRQVFPDTFDDHINKFGQGKIDISFSNPFVYAKLAGRFGGEAFTRIIEEDGRAEFRGKIIARRDNQQIKTLEDCKGTSWVAVDPSSAGGYLFVLGHFVEHGITLDDFAEVVFAGGRQENVILGVYSGLHDIGAIREGSLSVVEDKIDTRQIKIIDHSRWYPGWVYAHSPRLTDETVARIKEAMLNLDYDNPEHREILEAARFKGFVPSSDEDFDPIRDLSEKVGLELD
ncbi:phosphate/phosphite/phosphonate ABC transporter substrate-binding protein [Desulfonatronospira sp.]|uniref:phosphate/phosphite/phosphonate ABC transporter substrate-binding protein n=1 Tax=Desulfonatronospira sp. TaxID=1962951 RepID=UPI0025C0824E|nr:phosphate/phosphite/phosphonate ABC transporter substrate-binding protein [Desulfonatronospira sp.]